MQLTGTYTAIATPFRLPDYAIDVDALLALIARQLQAGVSGIVPCGSTGEFSTLTLDERRQMLETTLRAVDGRAQVIAQTGASEASDASALARHAEAAGAVAALALPPVGGSLTLDAASRFYDALVEAVQIPVIFYYNPGATGLALTGEQIAALCRNTGIHHVKYTSPDVSALAELLFDHTDIQVLTGWDHLLLFANLAGATAAIVGAANVLPEACVQIVDPAAQAAPAGAIAAWRRSAPVLNALGAMGYVPAVKAASASLGHPLGPPRPPSQTLSPLQAARLEALVHSAVAA